MKLALVILAALLVWEVSTASVRTDKLDSDSSSKESSESSEIKLKSTSEITPTEPSTLRRKRSGKWRYFEDFDVEIEFFFFFKRLLVSDVWSALLPSYSFSVTTVEYRTILGNLWSVLLLILKSYLDEIKNIKNLSSKKRCWFVE